MTKAAAGGEAATVHDDGDLQVPPRRMRGRDVEIAADVDEDGADGVVAVVLGDLGEGGQAGRVQCGDASLQEERKKKESVNADAGR